MDLASGLITHPATSGTGRETAEGIASTLSPRLYSLDVMRGGTMALMLMVDVCGDTVPFFSHAEWSGLHLADFVMPSFIIIVGASLAHSLPKALTRRERGEVFVSACIRSCKLFAVGLLMQGPWIPAIDGSKDMLGFDLEKVRIMGILQRISICYISTAALVLYVTSETARNGIVFSLVILQQAILGIVSVPGCPVHGDKYSRECNSEAYIDRIVLGASHLYRPELGYDPEGLVSTLGCVLTCFAGYLVVQPRWRNYKARIGISGVISLMGLLAWSVGDIPFNKALWTVSFNLTSIGVCVTFLTCIDCLNIRNIDSNPLAHLGMNAIFFFICSDSCGLFNVLIQSFWLTRDGAKVTLTSWFIEDILSVPTHPDYIVIYALVQLIFYLGVTRFFFQRRIFFKL